jgi:hypothetical protein
VDLGVKVKGAKLSSVVFTPAVYKSYSHPDYGIIRTKTAQAIERSERTTEPLPEATPTPKPTPGVKVTADTEACSYKPVAQ